MSTALVPTDNPQRRSESPLGGDCEAKTCLWRLLGQSRRLGEIHRIKLGQANQEIWCWDGKETLGTGYQSQQTAGTGQLEAFSGGSEGVVGNCWEGHEGTAGGGGTRLATEEHLRWHRRRD